MSGNSLEMWLTGGASRVARLTAGAVVGVLAGLYVLVIAHAQSGSPDFDQWYIAAQAMRAGLDPYAVHRETEWDWPLYYPVTTIVPVLPLTAFSLTVARALFAGLGAACLAYGLAREPWRLWLLASGAMVAALYFVQWSPWLVAAVLTPQLGWALTCKPSFGLALGVTHFSWRLLASALALLAVSFLIWPGWVPHWIDAVREGSNLHAPITRPGGFLLLLALLRWRRRDARLLLAFALVPQTILVHEALPLGLLAQSKRELQAFAALTLLVCGLMLRLSPEGSHEAYMAWNWWPMLGLVYLPALVLVLLRPNAISLPARPLRA